MNKNILIEYYKNRIFETKYGCWQLNIGVWNGLNMYLNNNKEYPFKIYKNYNSLPIDFDNIDNYILYIDGKETHYSFDFYIKKYNITKIPKYDILLYFKNPTNSDKNNIPIHPIHPIHYSFQFSDLFLYQKLYKKNYNFIQNLNDKIFLFNSLLYLLQNSYNNNNNDYNDYNIIDYITDQNMIDNIYNI